MKRFTDTAKWVDPWFQDLSPELKLLWIYICDNCDSAGVWKVNMRLAEFSIGYAYPNATLTLLYGDRVVDLGDGKVWVRKFCQFQYGNLSATCPPHRSIIQRLKEFNLPINGDTLTLPLVKGTDTLQDKTIQEKDMERNGGMGENQSRPSEMPESAKSARNYASAVGCPPEFAEQVWMDRDGTAWVDGTGRPITKFHNYLAKMWRAKQDRDAKEKHYATTQRRGEQRIDRSIGTCNEGTAHLYEGIGRMGDVPQDPNSQ